MGDGKWKMLNVKWEMEEIKIKYCRIKKNGRHYEKDYEFQFGTGDWGAAGGVLCAVFVGVLGGFGW